MLCIGLKYCSYSVLTSSIFWCGSADGLPLRFDGFVLPVLYCLMSRNLNAGLERELMHERGKRTLAEIGTVNFCDTSMKDKFTVSLLQEVTNTCHTLVIGFMTCHIYYLPQVHDSRMIY